jgi:hypothetical protein
MRDQRRECCSRTAPDVLLGGSNHGNDASEVDVTRMSRTCGHCKCMNCPDVVSIQIQKRLEELPHTSMCFALLNLYTKILGCGGVDKSEYEKLLIVKSTGHNQQYSNLLCTY